MVHESHDKPGKNQIHCPYCWKEFLNFEQIGSGIDFNYHLYEDFLILPVEKATSFPFLIRNKQFGKQQHLENIKCPRCFREYSIALLPFGRKEKSAPKTRSETSPDKVSFLTAIKQKPVLEILSNWKIFLIFNYFPILAFFSSILAQSLLWVSIYLVLASEFLLIRYLSDFSKEFDRFLEIEKMPLILDERYQQSKDFFDFKDLFSNTSNLKQKNTSGILKIALIVSLILFGASMVLNSQIFSIQDFPSLANLFIIEPGLFLFFFFFSIFVTTILFVLLDSLDYLTLISTKMLLRLDPWETTQKIEVFKKFWIYSLGLYIFSSIVFPVFLNYKAINVLIENYQTPQKFIQLFLPMLITPFAIVSIIVTTAVIIIFISLLFSFDSNIKLRKRELIDDIKRKLSEIKSKHDPSNEDVVKSEMMLKEMDLIEKIPQFFWKLSIIPIVFDVLSIGISLYNLFFPVK